MSEPRDMKAMGYDAVMHYACVGWTRDQIERAYDKARRTYGEYHDGVTEAYASILGRRFGERAVERAKLGVNFTDHRLLFDVREYLIDEEITDIDEAVKILTDIIDRKVTA